jgi:hypothetical protein
MISLLSTRKQIRISEAGNLPHEALRQATGEVDQFPRQVVIDRRSLIRRDRLKRANDVLGKLDRHRAKGEQRRERSSGIRAECFVNLRERPAFERGADELPPQEAPRALYLHGVAVMPLDLALELREPYAREARRLGQVVRLHRMKEHGTDAVASLELLHVTT